jgi:hypothetical protein
MLCRDLAIAAYEWRGDTPRVADTREWPFWLANLRGMVGEKRGDRSRVAKSAKMPLQQLQAILDGNNLKPQVDTLERIALACNRELSDVFARPENGAGHARGDSGESSGTRVEDHLAAIISHLGALEGQARAEFALAVTSLFTALEHTRPAAAGGSPENDGR